MDLFKNIFKGDKVIWIIFLMLCLISIVEVFSASSSLVYSSGDHWGPISRHLMFLGIGTVCVCIIHNLPYQWFSLIGMILLPISVILLIVVMFTGRINDAARWINIAGFQFQPSEMLKVAVVLFLAHQLAKRQKTISTQRIIPTLKFWKWNTPEERAVWRDGGKALFVPIVLSCMAILPAHTSSAVIVFLVSVAMLIIGRVQWTEIWRLIMWAILGVSIVFMLGIGRGDTAGGRISTWIELWTTSRMEVAAEDLTDTERAMIAIHNGGILGRGAGHSTVRVEMTHPESDYAFALFVEEYGIVIAAILIALYVWVFFRAIEIFKQCPEKYPSLLSLGVALLITV